MISIGNNNNTSINITPDETNNFAPIKIGNKNNKSVNVTKIFYGVNGYAKEIYFTPLYDFRHQFIYESLKGPLVTVSCSTLTNRDPSNPVCSCDILNIVGDPNNDTGFGYGQPNTVTQSADDDIKYYSRLSKYYPYIKNLNMTDINHLDGTSAYINTFAFLEYLELDGKCSEYYNVFNDCPNLKTVRIGNTGSWDTPSNIDVKFSFRYLKNLSVIFFDKIYLPIYLKLYDTISSEVFQNTVVYRSNFDYDYDIFAEPLGLVQISDSETEEDKALIIENKSLDLYEASTMADTAIFGNIIEEAE